MMVADTKDTETKGAESKKTEDLSARGWPVTLHIASKTLTEVLAGTDTERLLKSVDLYVERANTFKKFLEPLAQALEKHAIDPKGADLDEKEVFEDINFITSAKGMLGRALRETRVTGPLTGKELQKIDTEKLSEYLFLRPLIAYGTIGAFVTNVINTLPEIRPKSLVLSSETYENAEGYKNDYSLTPKVVRDIIVIASELSAELMRFKPAYEHAIKAYRVFNEAIGSSGTKESYKKAFADFCNGVSYFIDPTTSRDPEKIMYDIDLMSSFVEKSLLPEYDRLFPPSKGQNNDSADNTEPKGPA